jgi:uncharacterized protein
MPKEIENPAVLQEPKQHRFILPITEDAVGAAYYREDADGNYVLTHTEVPGEYTGHGIASALAKGVFGIARARKIGLVLRCPFMTKWFAKHPEYADVVVG